MQWHPWWPSTTLHPHLVFEMLAYFTGFQLLRIRQRRSGEALAVEQRIWLLVAAVAGAALGAKLLFWLEDPAATWAHRTDPDWLITGRTIVGALLGGWIGTELAKKPMGIVRSTGDLYVLPLAVGMAIGRVGCFLSGVEDGTHGIETSFVLGMDLGDGLIRHPTALYEIGFLALLGALLERWKAPLEGDRFLGFMAGYLGFRLGVEFLKTQPALVAGLSAIQLACIAGLAYTAWVAWSRRR